MPGHFPETWGDTGGTFLNFSKSDAYFGSLGTSLQSIYASVQVLGPILVVLMWAQKELKITWGSAPMG